MVGSTEYSPALKAHALALVPTLGYAGAARETGVQVVTLRGWGRSRGLKGPPAEPRIHRAFAHAGPLNPTAGPTGHRRDHVPTALEVATCPPHHWNCDDPRRWVCLKCPAAKEIAAPRWGAADLLFHEAGYHGKGTPTER